MLVIVNGNFHLNPSQFMPLNSKINTEVLKFGVSLHFCKYSTLDYNTDTTQQFIVLWMDESASTTNTFHSPCWKKQLKLGLETAGSGVNQLRPAPYSTWLNQLKLGFETAVSWHFKLVISWILHRDMLPLPPPSFHSRTHFLKFETSMEIQPGERKKNLLMFKKKQNSSWAC